MEDKPIDQWQDDAKNFPYKHMEIRSSDRERKTLDEMRSLAQIDTESLDSVQHAPICNLFTYFDCTDYVDIQDTAKGRTSEAEGIVTYAHKKSALNLVDYLELCLGYFIHWPKPIAAFLPWPSPINVHGGYFDGVFTQELMYKLAFQGFSGLLLSLAPDHLCQADWETLDLETRKTLLTHLSQQAEAKEIQSVLAPIRYQQDILTPGKQV